MTRAEYLALPKRKPICHPNEKHIGHGLCGVCYRQQPHIKERHRKDYHRRAKIRSYPHGISQYGLTGQQYLNLFVSQNGVCAICFKPESIKKHLNVDHCHKTNRIRGLLCTTCNLGIGHLKDSKELLMNAINYLEEVA